MKTLALLCLISAVHALSFKWTGLGGDKLWTNIANWDKGAIPTQSDTCTIEGKFEAMIGTPDGASCSSLVLADGAKLTANTPTNFGVLNVTDSNLAISTGAGMFTVNAATFNGTCDVQVAPSTVSGFFSFGPKVMVTLDAKGGVVTVQAGMWLNEGQLTITDGTQLYSHGSIGGTGSVTLSGTAAMPTVLRTAVLSAGKVQVQGAVQMVNVLLASSLTVTAGSTLNFTAGGNATASTITLESGAFLGVNGGSNVQASTISGGAVEVDAAKLFAKELDDVTSVTVIQGGRLNLQNGGKVATLSADVAWILTHGSLSVDTLTTNGQVTFNGTGAYAVGELTLGDVSIIAASVSVSKSAMAPGHTITLDGHLSLAASATLNLGNTQGNQLWSPSSPARPGTLTAAGTVRVSGGATFFSVNWQGHGDIVVSGTATFQAITVDAHNVQLTSASSEVKGSGVTFGYDMLTGPSTMAQLAVTTNQTTIRCNSPCNASHPTSEAGVFDIKVLSA